MNGKDIRFAKEYGFTLRLELIPTELKVNQELNYRVVGESILLEVGNRNIDAEIVGPARDVLEIISVYKDRSILRLDYVEPEKQIVSVSLLCFYQRIDFDRFIVVVDQAIHSELRKRKIDVNTAAKWIKSQIVLDNKYAFALGTDKKRAELLLLGKDVSVLVSEAPQGYMHVTAIKDNRRNIYDGSISLIKGEISIEDRITEKAAITDEFKDRYNALIRDNAELIDLWRTYDDLEMEAIKQDAENMGFLKYKSFKRSGEQLVFMLDGCRVDPDFLRQEMYYVAIPTVGFNYDSPLDYSIRLAAIVGTEFDPRCVHTAEFRIIEDAQDDFRTIPDKGFLLPSISGSVIQSKRRRIARESILNGRNQLSGLNVLLQSGEVVGITGAHRAAITDSLEKYIFGNSGFKFLDRQKKAIDIAVNTPDIALIQGPPGTGKTLVIRSIVQRINELENGQARILVTSTQHDAVDNAIKDMTYGGVPVNRALSKLRNKTGDLPIYQWIDEMIDSCELWLSSHTDSDNDRFSEIYNAIEGIKNSQGIELQKALDKFYEILLVNGFPADFLARTQSLSSKCVSSSEVIGDNNSTLQSLLSTQKTTVSEFVECGRDAMVALERFLKYENENFEFEIPEYWKKLKRFTSVTDEMTTLLEKFNNDIQLLSTFGNSESKDDNVTLIEEELISLINDVESQLVFMNGNKSSESDLYDLIWTFKHELSSTANVKNIISSYSQVNAATCQQAANRNINPTMKGLDDAYDYVIIDEAARSNPLDLLIPMSLGRKIILVGDHKQLPHLVEREIVERVVEKTNDAGVADVLEESLFMRLFNKVQSEDVTSGTNRTCVLNEQFRMHPTICDLINVFYHEEQLKSACLAEEKAHNLGLYDNKPLAWIDVPAKEPYHFEMSGKSKSRQDEINVLIDELKKVLISNSEYRVGVISFYAKQVSMIQEAVDEEFPDESYRIEIGTVDAFQGKEFDVVVLSTVRSNQEEDVKKRVGFLNNNNRLCVAFSRAKRLLIAIGDADTVATDGETVYVEALNELLNMCKEGEAGYYECKAI